MIARADRLAGSIVMLMLALGCDRTDLDEPGRASPVANGTNDASGDPGPCGEATCLATLFASCEAEGGCTIQVESSPSGSFTTTCYDNGVTQSSISTSSGSTVTGKVTARRAGQVCYTVEWSSAIGVSGVDYVIRDGDGTQVATAKTADKAGSLIVACHGKSPVTVSHDCGGGDTTACQSGTCP